MKENTLLKEFRHYVALNICGMIGLSCYILADTFFVSKDLGADGLTALNLARKEMFREMRRKRQKLSVEKTIEVLCRK